MVDDQTTDREDERRHSGILNFLMRAGAHTPVADNRPSGSVCQRGVVLRHSSRTGQHSFWVGGACLPTYRVDVIRLQFYLPGFSAFSLSARVAFCLLPAPFLPTCYSPAHCLTLLTRHHSRCHHRYPMAYCAPLPLPTTAAFRLRRAYAARCLRDFSLLRCAHAAAGATTPLTRARALPCAIYTACMPLQPSSSLVPFHACICLPTALFSPRTAAFNLLCLLTSFLLYVPCLLPPPLALLLCSPCHASSCHALFSLSTSLSTLCLVPLSLSSLRHALISLVVVAALMLHFCLFHLMPCPSPISTLLPHYPIYIWTGMDWFGFGVDWDERRHGNRHFCLVARSFLRIA